MAVLASIIDGLMWTPSLFLTSTVPSATFIAVGAVSPAFEPDDMTGGVEPWAALNR